MMFALVALAAAAVVSATSPSATVTVNTPLGEVKGLRDGLINKFYGIPYAQPPLGSLRFQHAATVKPWTGVYDATEKKGGCIQYCHQVPHACPLTTSEDCLHLNVFAPAAATSKDPLPVMIWWYGGNFRNGAGDVPFYNGFFDAEFGDVIVVTANYRLGALGFLYNPALGVPGNMGFTDQIETMKWVKNNIASFGGDPGRVTIWGQSAGATSTAVHQASPQSAGLFHRVIAESNPMGLTMNTKVAAGKMAKTFGKKLNCKTKSCLMSASASAILVAQKASNTNIGSTTSNGLILKNIFQIFYPWTPVAGTDYLPEQPINAFTKGFPYLYSDVDVLWGTNKDEGTIFVYEVFKKPVSALKKWLILEGFWITHGIAMGKMYNDGHSVWHKNPDTRSQIADMITDFLFWCPIRKAQRAVAARGTKAYGYLYSHVGKDSYPWIAGGFPYCADKVCHAAEIPMTFSLDKIPAANITMTAQESHMSREMVRAWTNFAYTGNPNDGPHTLETTFPAFSASDDALMNYQEYATGKVSAQLNQHHKTQCDYMDTHVGYPPICGADTCAPSSLSCRNGEGCEPGYMCTHGTCVAV